MTTNRIDYSDRNDWLQIPISSTEAALLRKTFPDIDGAVKLGDPCKACRSTKTIRVFITAVDKQTRTIRVFRSTWARWSAVFCVDCESVQSERWDLIERGTPQRG